MPRNGKIFLQLAASLTIAGVLAVFSPGGCGRPPDNVRQAKCAVDADCATPQPCEMALGAVCVQGFCQFPAKICDTPPDPECVNDDAAGKMDAIYRTYSSAGTCQSDGTCSYPPTDTPCATCSSNCLGSCQGITCDDLHDGCRTAGHCVPGTPPTCVYDNAPDEQSCEDGNLCTTGDRCVAGECVSTGNKTCAALGSCFGTNLCEPTTGLCSAPMKDTSALCDDGNACTYNDHCNGSGACTGTTISCSSTTGTCGVTRTCNGTSSCDTYYPSAGKSCNDGIACTKDDKCGSSGSGACSGTAYSCITNNGCLTVSCDGNGGCPSTNACTSNQYCCDKVGGNNSACLNVGTPCPP